jgi:adenylate kinase family enzyme
MCGIIASRSSIGNQQPAILILGPTGSGKTPLGMYLEKRGLNGRKCEHFDFGSCLRRLAACRKRPLFLSRREYRIVKEVLASGALLPDRDFGIARKILCEFIRRRNLASKSLVVLNGMPRHVGQARDVAGIVDVRMVVNLVCTSGTVMSRIRSDSGGDRRGRVDDSVLLVGRKLRIFRRNTLPLIGYYRRRGVKVRKIVVAEDITPAVIRKMLECCTR